MQGGARARHAAFHRADRAAADFRPFLIGQAARADQHQRLALIDGQHHQRALDIGKMQAVVLIVGGDEQPLGRRLVIIRREFPAAHLRQETIAQDDESPALHAGRAGDIGGARFPRLQHGFLHQIVGEVGIPRQAAAKGAQVRQHRRQFLLEARIVERLRRYIADNMAFITNPDPVTTDTG